MKLCIAGSRTITGKDGMLAVRKAVSAALKEHGYGVEDIEYVLSGKAKGVDTIGEERARLLQIPVAEFPADWEKYGRRAGMIRNEEMAKAADLVVIVWDGVSPGSKGMIDICKRLGKPHYVYIPCPF